MGSYLCQKDAIHLSQTCHLFHRKTHKKSFVDCYADGASKDTLYLKEKDILSIVTGNKTNPYFSAANLSFNKYNKLIIGSEIPASKTISCDIVNNCAFCKLINICQTKTNYDLQWFGQILSAAVSFSNSWPCLRSKKSLLWLLSICSPYCCQLELLQGTSRNGGWITDINSRAFANMFYQ